MKKLFVLLIAILVLVPVAFAQEGETETVDPAKDLQTDFIIDRVQHGLMPTSVRSLGMGNVGIALPSNSDSFFFNPASLADHKFQLSLPSVAVTVNHAYDLLKPGADGESVLSSLLHMDMNGSEDGMQDMIGPAVNGVLSLLKKGLGKIATVDAGLSFSIGGFGMATNVQANIYTYGKAGLAGDGELDFTKAALFAEVKATETLGLGLRFQVSDDFSIDAGVAARFSYLAYTGPINADKVLSSFGFNSDGTVSEDGPAADPMAFLNEMPLAAGWSVPVDLGLTFNMPYGFTAAVVYRNLDIFGYQMQIYDNYEGFLSDWAASFDMDGDGKFKIKNYGSLDLGFAWQWDNAFFRPTIAFDIVDVVGMCQTKDFGIKDFVYHLNIGAEIELLSVLDIRGGLNQGYWTVGAGLNLYVLKLDVAYFWDEMGAYAGEAPLDGLAVRLNIGW